MSDTLRLDGIFADGMVLQRNAENCIWGWDSAPAVTVTLEGREYTAPTENGKFRVTLPPHEAAVGCTITVKGSDTVTLSDVCFGDVLLLTGQSNMELPVGRVLDASPDVVSDNYPLIRQFIIAPPLRIGSPADGIAAAPWLKAAGDDLLQFSAAGYFCARRLFAEKNIPIGLVLAAQGGSSVEAWMPADALTEFGDFSPEIDRFVGDTALGEFLSFIEKRDMDWAQAQEMNVDESFSAAIPENAGAVKLPAMLRDTELKGFSGSLWFYKEFTLENEPQGTPFLYVGELIDSDRTFINGVKVGETGYRYPPRRYFFDAAPLRKGKNLLAVRLLVKNGDGGFIPEHPYFLDTGAERVELSGEWQYAIEHRAEENAPDWFMAQHVPTWLYNASIVPLAGLGFMGSLWYQGETNAGRWERYDEKFATMLRCWRKVLGQALPVICVEMCDYDEPMDPEHDISGWEKIQQFQRGAADTAENCRCVSAKDLGQPLELHPQLKEELGERLAKAALKFFYQD
ncbi:MAG: sialate O-acetylesterase [Ruminococcaceae bacterium]|nr:sialate O-acetylesterase [Oscillospiraceae bacterium]